MKYHRQPTSRYAHPIHSTRGRVYLSVVLTVVLFILSAAYAFPQQTAKLGIPVGFMDTPFRLGLDLQGGTHLVYEADMSEIPNEDRASALEGVKDVIERRVNAFGVSEPIVQTTVSGDSYRVIVELAGVMDVNEAIKLIGETPVLEFKEPSNELDRQPTEEELAKLAEMNDQEQAVAQDVLNRALAGEDWATLPESGALTKINPEWSYFKNFISAIDSWSWPGRILPQLVENDEGLNVVRFDGTEESEETQLSHILVCYQGKTGCASDRSALDASILINNLKEQATPDNFVQLAKDNSDDSASAVNGGDLDWLSPGETVPAFELAATATEVGNISNVVETDFGYHLIYKRAVRPITLYNLTRILFPYTKITDLVPPASPWKNTDLSGRQLTRAVVQFDQTTGAPYVAISFNSDGDKLFGELTERLVGQPIAIFLDGETITTPVVQSAIYGGQAVITGQFTVDEAKLLAQRLNAGALPVALNILSQQTVGPSLGQISLEKSVSAALFGFLFVVLFMVIYYRLAGLLAAIALLIYAILNLAAYKLLGVTITLAGIAGFILSMGMAVDANVLIFERFREELKAGRDLLGAIDEGFKRAWTSIRDGNLTTLIAAAVLFWFSTSFIKGFALTLMIGVLLSMFSAIVITRVWMRLLSGWRWARVKWLYGVREKVESRE